MSDKLIVNIDTRMTKKKELRFRIRFLLSRGGGESTVQQWDDPPPPCHKGKGLMRIEIVFTPRHHIQYISL